MILAVSAITGALSQRLGEPSRVAHLLAGLGVGPHAPLPLFADNDRVQTLASRGGVLLTFAVRLEFGVSRRPQVLSRAGAVAGVQLGARASIGGAAGALAGRSGVEQTLLDAAVANWSTTVVSAAFASVRRAHEPCELVLGVLVTQVVVAVVLLDVKAAIDGGGPGSPLGTWPVGGVGRRTRSRTHGPTDSGPARGALTKATIAAVVAGRSRRTGIVAGLSRGRVGPFGVLLPGLGAGAGAGPRMIASLVGVALATTSTIAWAVSSADWVVPAVDARLPRRVERLLGWYEGWSRGPRP